MGKAKSRKKALQELAELRAEFAIQHACVGFKIEFEDALSLIRNADESKLSAEEIAKRDRIVAAIDNLVEFAVCAEYQLMKDVYSINPDFDFESDELDFDDEDEMADYIKACEKYNKIHAAVENDDIEYAMAVAFAWLKYNENTYLTYWTQNDDRVRPWHYALQGFSAKRDDFPSWMIPPIEWACRCFLISGQDASASSDLRNIHGKLPDKPAQLDGVFSESVAKCGRIFSKAHRYFEVDKADKKMLSAMVRNIKKSYYGKKD